MSILAENTKRTHAFTNMQSGFWIDGEYMFWGHAQLKITTNFINVKKPILWLKLFLNCTFVVYLVFAACKACYSSTHPVKPSVVLKVNLFVCDKEICTQNKSRIICAYSVLTENARIQLKYILPVQDKQLELRKAIESESWNESEHHFLVTQWLNETTVKCTRCWSAGKLWISPCVPAGKERRTMAPEKRENTDSWTWWTAFFPQSFASLYTGARFKQIGQPVHVLFQD